MKRILPKLCSAGCHYLQADMVTPMDTRQTYLSLNEDHLLPSNFGENAYECVGSCYCKENTDFNDGTLIRRASLTSFPRTLAYLATAITSIVAYQQAKRVFDDECISSLSEVCSMESIESEVEDCEQRIESVDAEKEDVEEGHEKNDEDKRTEEIFFGGGCFWGVEHLLAQLDGVLSTEVGYMGGLVDNPTYEDICSGDTEHVEVVRVEFDPDVISVEEIVKYFFEIHNPEQVDQQGVDFGTQYHSTIFYQEDSQKPIISDVIQILEKKENIQVRTTVRRAQNHQFWKAEEYHQKFVEKNPNRLVCHWHEKKF